MPGKANIFGFHIVIEEVFLIYLSDMSQLASVKLTVTFFSIKAIMPRGSKHRYSLCLLTGAQR